MIVYSLILKGDSSTRRIYTKNPNAYEAKATHEVRAEVTPRFLKGQDLHMRSVVSLEETGDHIQILQVKKLNKKTSK